MVTRRTSETIEFSNRTVIEVHTCSYRTTRGYTLAGVVCDEIALWRSEDSATRTSRLSTAYVLVEPAADPVGPVVAGNSGCFS
jgi:hypothetical protein